MKWYLYDKNNFYYEEIILQASPLEPDVYFDQINCTRISPPKTLENEIAYWNNESWEIKPDYSGKVYYNKIDRSEKIFEKGEQFDDNYTDVKPTENENFLIFEDKNWIIDDKAKFEYENKKSVERAKTLLSQSDWTQTQDNINIREKSWVEAWTNYRADLRKFISGKSDFFPISPDEVK